MQRSKSSTSGMPPPSRMELDSRRTINKTLTTAPRTLYARPSWLWMECQYEPGTYVGSLSQISASLQSRTSRCSSKSDGPLEVMYKMKDPSSARNSASRGGILGERLRMDGGIVARNHQSHRESTCKVLADGALCSLTIAKYRLQRRGLAICVTAHERARKERNRKIGVRSLRSAFVEIMLEV